MIILNSQKILKKELYYTYLTEKYSDYEVNNTIEYGYSAGSPF